MIVATLVCHDVEPNKDFSITVLWNHERNCYLEKFCSPLVLSKLVNCTFIKKKSFINCSVVLKKFFMLFAALATQYFVSP